MPKFSDLSNFRLSTCHPDLVTLFNEVIKHVDCTILVGYRNQADQEKAYAEGKTKLHYPDGNHNKKPSLAVDACFYPVPDWGKPQNFLYFGGIVMGIAAILLSQGKITHPVRYGGNWLRDNNVADNSFSDLDHFELVMTNEKITS